MKRRILSSLLWAGLALLVVILLYLNYIGPAITGYSAKGLASGVFLSGRTQESLEEEDLNFSFMKYTKNKVDYEKKKSSAGFYSGNQKPYTTKVLAVRWYAIFLKMK